MGYTKLHSTILDSSVWLEPAHVRLVWITMLAMADQHGVVHASVGGLAHRARVSKEEANDSIARFLGPDPDSRDRTTGERIEEVPGGWLVLNHANYRDKQTREQALTAERVARHRAKNKTVTDRYVTPGNGPLLMPMPMESASAAASVPSEPQKKVKPKADVVEEVLATPEFQRFWSAYDLKKGRDEAAKSWGKIAPDQHLAATIVAAARGYAEDNPDKAYRKHPATWLNQKGWLDERVAKGRGTERKTGGQLWRDQQETWQQSTPIRLPVLNDIPYDET